MVRRPTHTLPAAAPAPLLHFGDSRHPMTGDRAYTTTASPQPTSGSSDHTSSDDDHLDLDDALALLTRDSMDSDALAATVEHAIAAVYDAVTREEARAAAAAVGDTNSPQPHSRHTTNKHTATLSDRNSTAMSSTFSDDERSSNASTSFANETDSNALKRARRSEIEKKSRQRRQGVLRRMRDDVDRLECIYAALVEQQTATGALDIKPTQRQDVAAVHAQLAVVAQSLATEQRELQRAVADHTAFLTLLATPEIQAELENPVHGLPTTPSFAAPFELLTDVAIATIVRESHAAICRFEIGRADDFQTTGASFMGWTDRRKYDVMTSALQYGFTKTFPLERAHGLLHKTWDVFRDPIKMAQLSFDSSVKMRFQVLQTLGANDDVYVIRRDHMHPNLPCTFLTVHILFRLETPSGYTLCFRSIPAPAIQNALEPHEIWYDVFHWTHFNHICDDVTGEPVGCEVVTGGSIEDPTTLIARHWLLELIISVLRWESMCVSPLFIKL